jgi:hypothetical protein
MSLVGFVIVYLVEHELIPEKMSLVGVCNGVTSRTGTDSGED